jgi:exosortase
MTDQVASSGRFLRGTIRLGLALTFCAVLTWNYWPTLTEMAHRWSVDPRYSHGYLVPLFSVFLFSRRGVGTTSSKWAGVAGFALLALGLGLKLAGARVYNSWLDGVSLLPTLAGVALILGGRSLFRRAWLPIAFLIFMIPLPYRVEIAMGEPLQRLATKVSTYAMQTLGLPAISEGNIIHVDDVDIGVAEACSGLSMLFTFIAIAVGVAILMERPWLDRVLVVLSAVPIALLVNILRVTVTGVLHVTVGERIAGLVFHDLAGWLMMPTAIGLLWLEIALLKRLLLDPIVEPEASLVAPREPARRQGGPGPDRESPREPGVDKTRRPPQTSTIR